MLHQLGVEYILSGHTSFIKEDINTYCQYFLCHIVTNNKYIDNYNTTFFNKQLETICNEEQFELYKKMCIEMVQYPTKPIQYILGNECFYGNMIECQPPILIPRPETEQLIDIIKADLMETSRINENRKYNSKLSNNNEDIHILDIGSGSGIIGLSLLLPSPYEIHPNKTTNTSTDTTNTTNPNMYITAIDINKQAVDLSIKNATRILATHEPPGDYLPHPDAKSNQAQDQYSQYKSKYPLYQCHHTSFMDYVDNYKSNKSDTSLSLSQSQAYPLFDVIVSNPPCKSMCVCMYVCVIYIYIYLIQLYIYIYI